MGGIRSYFTAVVAVCMIAVLVHALAKHGTIQRMVRLIVGMLIVLVVLKPLGGIDLDALSKELLGLSGQLPAYNEPEEAYQQALRKNIKENTQQYIQNFAETLGAYVQAEVTLSEEEYPVPAAVRIVGSLTQTQFQALYAYVTESLGIAQENQEWVIYDASW